MVLMGKMIFVMPTLCYKMKHRSEDTSPERLSPDTVGPFYTRRLSPFKNYIGVVHTYKVKNLVLSVI
jgi:hypothetical protein